MARALTLGGLCAAGGLAYPGASQLIRGVLRTRGTAIGGLR